MFVIIEKMLEILLILKKQKDKLKSKLLKPVKNRWLSKVTTTSRRIFSNVITNTTSLYWTNTRNLPRKKQICKNIRCKLNQLEVKLITLSKRFKMLRTKEVSFKKNLIILCDNPFSKKKLKRLTWTNFKTCKSKSTQLRLISISPEQIFWNIIKKFKSMKKSRKTWQKIRVFTTMNLKS